MRAQPSLLVIKLGTIRIMIIKRNGESSIASNIYTVAMIVIINVDANIQKQERMLLVKLIRLHAVCLGNPLSFATLILSQIARESNAWIHILFFIIFILTLSLVFPFSLFDFIFVLLQNANIFVCVHGAKNIELIALVEGLFVWANHQKIILVVNEFTFCTLDGQCGGREYRINIHADAHIHIHCIVGGSFVTNANINHINICISMQTGGVGLPNQHTFRY